MSEVTVTDSIVSLPSYIGSRYVPWVINENLVKWEAWLRAAGRPDTTIELRTYHVRRVFTEIDKSPWEITTDDLVMWLAERGWAPNTRRAYRASLRSFYQWAQAMGLRADSPAHLLPAITVPRALPRPAPEVIWRQAYLSAGERERRMIRLAAAYGLRRGEISRAHTDDLEQDLIGWHLVVHGKGGKQRNVPLADKDAADFLTIEPGWFFPSSSPKRPGMPLTPRYVGDLIGDLLPGVWTCHSLRHRAASTFYQSTKDQRATQEFLGHAKPETTALYTLVPDKDIRAGVEATAA